MYEAFYGFHEKPFHVTADPGFLYPSRDHREALSHLLYGIRQRLGFIMITGEVGTGKTSLAKALVAQMGGATRTALILNPGLWGNHLLRTILNDFNGRPCSDQAGQGEWINSIEQLLLKQAENGGTAVLILDEAQTMNTDTLEQIRLLSNVETAKMKLLQIILLGQPELTQRLREEPRLRPLQERIAVRYQIQPLDEKEVAAYITHRLRAAGAKWLSLFSPEAVARITRESGGIPRRINWICDHALLAGFVQDSKWIDERLVEEALRVGTSDRAEESEKELIKQS